MWLNEIFLRSIFNSTKVENAKEKQVQFNGFILYENTELEKELGKIGILEDIDEEYTKIIIPLHPETIDHLISVQHQFLANQLYHMPLGEYLIDFWDTYITQLLQLYCIKSLFLTEQESYQLWFKVLPYIRDFNQIWDNHPYFKYDISGLEIKRSHDHQFQCSFIPANALIFTIGDQTIGVKPDIEYYI